ncbi:MAG: hypothetical protein BWY09_03034 [Candidatus Hydrogenedentes bacterium ADurb.Bin179]|nr:MAG: hypothetical protein BWY09_03034 [Candidatus Hydrogenedentes bacterium ADurb.Bin179]
MGPRVQGHVISFFRGVQFQEVHRIGNFQNERINVVLRPQQAVRVTAAHAFISGLDNLGVQHGTLADAGPCAQHQPGIVQGLIAHDIAEGFVPHGTEQFVGIEPVRSGEFTCHEIVYGRQKGQGFGRHLILFQRSRRLVEKHRSINSGAYRLKVPFQELLMCFTRFGKQGFRNGIHHAGRAGFQGEIAQFQALLDIGLRVGTAVIIPVPNSTATDQHGRYALQMRAYVTGNLPCVVHAERVHQPHAGTDKECADTFAFHQEIHKAALAVVVKAAVFLEYGKGGCNGSFHKTGNIHTENLLTGPGRTGYPPMAVC